MGFYSKGLSRRRAMALAAGLTTSALSIWGGAVQAVAPYPAKLKSEGKHGGEDVSATEDLMRQHGVLRRILNAYFELAQRLQGDEGDIDTIALEEAAKLFRDFGEDHHELLEEVYIFPEVREAGGPNGKMVEVLLHQHQRGRLASGQVQTLRYRVARPIYRSDKEIAGTYFFRPRDCRAEAAKNHGWLRW